MAASLAAPVSAETATEAETGFIADFDWLVATNGKDEFREPLLTLNREDLQRFVTTGTITSRQQIGNLLIVERYSGTYYSTEEFSDTSLDEPASVRIKFKDQVIAGAKGLSFETRVADNYIMIEHWDLTLGCSLARWYLNFEFLADEQGVDLQVVETEYVILGTDEKCTPN